MPVYTRILYPGSKRSPLEDTRKFFGGGMHAGAGVQGMSLPARSSARYRQICISAARSFGNVIRRLCTITRRTTSLSGRRNADWCGLATAKRAVRCPLVQPGLFMDHDGFPAGRVHRAGEHGGDQHTQADGTDTERQVRSVGHTM